MLPPEVVMESGKVHHLVDLLARLKAKGSRPLIFSQWTNVLDILERVMRRLGYSYVRLDGSTAAADRQALCDKFNNQSGDQEEEEEESIFAFLLSTRAGGQGLNLTGADTVILHDVDFNPQMDRQAEDRAHRLGQTKTVTVHRLIAANTVDEKIHQMSLRKLQLGDAVLREGGAVAGTANEKSGDIAVMMMGEIIMDLLKK